MKKQNYSNTSLSNKNDEELVDIAQVYTDQFVTLRNQLKELSQEFQFEIDDTENQILNKVFASLKKQREKELNDITSQIPDIIKHLTSTMDNTNMNEIIQKINQINTFNEQGKIHELFDILKELKIPHTQCLKKKSGRTAINSPKIPINGKNIVLTEDEFAKFPNLNQNLVGCTINGYLIEDFTPAIQSGNSRIAATVIINGVKYHRHQLSKLLFGKVIKTIMSSK